MAEETIWDMPVEQWKALAFEDDGSLDDNSELAPSERLFQLAMLRYDLLRNSRDYEWYGEGIFQLPTLRQLTLETTSRMQIPKSGEIYSIENWLDLVCKCASGETFSKIIEWINLQSLIVLKSVLKFIGMKCSLKTTQNKSQCISQVIDLSFALKTHFSRVWDRNISSLRKYDELARPCSNLIDDPHFTEALLYGNFERFNGRRGFQGRTTAAQLTRCCRFCDEILVQIEPRVCPITKAERNIRIDPHLGEVDLNEYVHRSKQFCNEGCIFLYKLSSGTEHVRKALTYRDNGVCSSCSIETLSLMKQWLDRKKSGDAEVPPVPQVWAQLDVEPEQVARLFQKAQKRADKNPFRELIHRKRFGWRPGDLWQADHIVPVVLGGGVGFTPWSYRTLCTVCHQRVTTQLKRFLVGKGQLRRERSAGEAGDTNESTAAATDNLLRKSLTRKDRKGTREAGKKGKVRRWYRRRP